MFMPLRAVGIIFICILYFVVFTSCAGQNSGRRMGYHNDVFYEVNFIENELTYNDISYKFEINSGKCTITYPDGSEFWSIVNTFNDGSMGSWRSSGKSYNYSSNKYAPGEVLVDILESATQRRTYPNLLPSILLIIVGIIEAVYPRAFWYLTTGWKFKDVEPSDAALISHRVAGFAIIIFGFMYTFIN